jgi:GH15 family glucan-1,4-alpha-glucosidase
VRNWDYRFVWLRDAALAVEALARLGSHHEAMQYLDWVLGVLDTLDGPERLRPLYTVTGQELSSEGELAELSGYAGSRPVRIGNAAAQQVQLDVFGPIANLVWTLALSGAPLSSEHAALVEALVSAVRLRWREPDHGIWEPRRPPRHNVHSKVMCWVTVDRAATLAQEVWAGPRTDWKELADTIKADVLAHGWKPERNAFTAAYDGDDLDAAALHVGLSGMLAPDDPRFVGTVEAVERELRDGPTVYRYRTEDGLPGPEGGFHLLASWLVDAYLMIGRRDDARALFDELVGLAGPTGLYSEQVDPATRRALGNHPQAYSHIGLVHNALNLAHTVAGVGARRG